MNWEGEWLSILLYWYKTYISDQNYLHKTSGLVHWPAGARRKGSITKPPSSSTGSRQTKRHTEYVLRHTQDIYLSKSTCISGQTCVQKLFCRCLINSVFRQVQQFPSPREATHQSYRRPQSRRDTDCSRSARVFAFALKSLSKKE